MRLKRERVRCIWKKHGKCEVYKGSIHRGLNPLEEGLIASLELALEAGWSSASLIIGKDMRL